MNKNQKKFYIVLSVLLALVFTTKAFAALTFTNSAITGTTASTIDLGVGHDLYLQTSGGNVGIGTTNPGQFLTISANQLADNPFIRIVNTNPNLNAQFRTENDVGKGLSMWTAGSTGWHANRSVLYGPALDFFADGNLGSGDIRFFANPNSGWVDVPKVLITNTGSLGIGTTSPGAKIDIKDGHYASTQTTAPTASVTGTGYSGASMVAGSTDTKGKITATVGANAGTLVITFNSAYTTAPTCTTDASTATAQVDLVKMYNTTSTTALTLNFVASPTGGSETWSYICLQ